MFILNSPLFTNNIDFDFFVENVQGVFSKLFCNVKFGIFLIIIGKVLLTFKDGNSAEKKMLETINIFII